MEYKIVDGRVQTRALEYHIVDHCNLTCDHCCSFSPILPRWAADPAQFEKDLISVKRVVQPQFLKIVGGEPLLHPKLPTLLQIARDVGIAPRVSITTNAHLISRMPDEAWSLFEMLTVSIYPSAPVEKSTLRDIRNRARDHAIEVSWKVQDKFVTLNRENKSSFEEAKSTFEGCWIHHRCNSIKNGRFYSCTRPQYIQKFAENPERFAEDGVLLDSIPEADLALAIKAHLEATEPLNSCFLCKGGNAELKTQVQIDRRLIPEKRETMKSICREI